jgi:hypothetical protein
LGNLVFENLANGHMHQPCVFDEFATQINLLCGCIQDQTRRILADMDFTGPSQIFINKYTKFRGFFQAIYACMLSWAPGISSPTAGQARRNDQPHTHAYDTISAQVTTQPMGDLLRFPPGTIQVSPSWLPLQPAPVVEMFLRQKMKIFFFTKARFQNHHRRNSLGS